MSYVRVNEILESGEISGVYLRRGTMMLDAWWDIVDTYVRISMRIIYQSRCAPWDQLEWSEKSLRRTRMSYRRDPKYFCVCTLALSVSNASKRHLLKVISHRSRTMRKATYLDLQSMWSDKNDCWIINDRRVIITHRRFQPVLNCILGVVQSLDHEFNWNWIPRGAPYIDLTISPMYLSLANDSEHLLSICSCNWSQRTCEVYRAHRYRLSTHLPNFCTSDSSY